MYFDDVLATELPLAPLIKKENLAPVCRSEILEHLGETITRITWLLFLFGVRVSFTAEYNRRMKTGLLQVAGKTVFQWNCEDPSDCPDLPHTFTREGQKFSLSWLVTDLKETFDLKVNG